MRFYFSVPSQKPDLAKSLAAFGKEIGGGIEVLRINRDGQLHHVRVNFEKKVTNTEGLRSFKKRLKQEGIEYRHT